MYASPSLCLSLNTAGPVETCHPECKTCHPERSRGTCFCPWSGHGFNRAISSLQKICHPEPEPACGRQAGRFSLRTPSVRGLRSEGSAFAPRQGTASTVPFRAFTKICHPERSRGTCFFLSNFCRLPWPLKAYRPLRLSRLLPPMQGESAAN